MFKTLPCLLGVLFAVQLSAQTVTPDAFRADLDTLRSQLPQRHANLFAHITPAAFNHAIDKIRMSADTLTVPTFEAALFRLMRAIGDEHTRVEPPYKAWCPLSFDFFAEGIYVATADEKNHGLLYARLDAIGGVPIATVLDRFKEMVKQDNPSYYRVFVMQFLNNPVFLRGIGCATSDTAVLYTLNGRVITVRATATSRGTHNQPYRYNVRPDSILCLEYLSCMEDPDQPFARFNDSLFAAVRRQHPRALVIDLRSNSGGNSGVLQPFLDSLRTSYLNRQRSLYVLLGKQTFSSALMNAVDLKRNYAATLVGEPTSGNINHYGETRGFRLPHTQIVIGYSTRYWENWKGHDGPLTPDVPVTYHVGAVRAGDDEALTEVIKLSKL